MTTTYPLLIPFQHRLSFDLSQKLGVGLGQRRPTPLSCHQLNVKQLTEIVAQASEEAEVLCLQRVRFGIEKGHVGRGTGEKRLFKLLQHLQSYFERVLQEPQAAAVVMVGAGRQVADQVAELCHDTPSAC